MRKDGQRKTVPHHHSRTQAKLTRHQLLSLSPFASGTNKSLPAANQEGTALFSVPRDTVGTGTGSGPRGKKKGDGEIWEVTEKGSGQRKENPSVTSLDIFKPSC